jgi:hypothetical protein
MAFYRALLAAVSEHHVIAPKVRVADVLKVAGFRQRKGQTPAWPRSRISRSNTVATRLCRSSPALRHINGTGPARTLLYRRIGQHYSALASKVDASTRCGTRDVAGRTYLG